LRYRLDLEARRLAPATINLRLAAVRRLAVEALLPAYSAPSWPRRMLGNGRNGSSTTAEPATRKYRISAAGRRAIVAALKKR
jgi:hypothetical protein